ncbi:MAG: MFS transporter [Solirubrobacterales bacterium]|nr:MFS transporter [Solirubrobacterales bacterium]
MEKKWLSLVAIITGIFMLLIDVTIVNVALPDIGTDLGASFSSLEWVVNAYTLTLASSLLVSGSLADLIGRKKVFAIGLVGFSLASLGCGLSDSSLMLNLMRAVQGIGGGMMFSTSLAIIAQTFHGHERGVAFGIVGATTGAAVAIGPLVGGLLTDAFGWEAIFFVNVPIGAAALLLTLRNVDESKDPHPAGIDWVGAILFTGALFLLIYSLVHGNDKGWGSFEIVGALVLAAVLMIIFGGVETRKEHPLFDMSLFRRPAFVGACIVAFCMSASLFALFLFLTFYIQGGVLGYSPLEAGLRFLPITGMMLVVGPIAGRLTTKVQVRYLLSGGLLAVAVGIFLMHGIDLDSGWSALILGFVVAGIGSGFVNPPLASTAIGVVEQRRSGMASGINATFRQVGIAAGVAGLGAIFQSRVTDLLAEKVAGTPAAAHADQLSAAVTAGQTEQAISRIPHTAGLAQVDQIRDAAHLAFIGGLNTLFLVTCAVALIGSIGAFLLVRQSDFIAPPGHE